MPQTRYNLHRGGGDQTAPLLKSERKEEQTHAKINIGGKVGVDGNFSQIFKRHRPRKNGHSRAPHILQIRMDNEDTWGVKDFKLHGLWSAKMLWEATICAGHEIAEGWFNHPLSW